MKRFTRMVSLPILYTCKTNTAAASGLRGVGVSRYLSLVTVPSPVHVPHKARLAE